MSNITIEKYWNLFSNLAGKENFSERKFEEMH